MYAKDEGRPSQAQQQLRTATLGVDTIRTEQMVCQQRARRIGLNL